MNSLFLTNKQGDLRAWPVVGLGTALILAVATIATLLSLSRPPMWGLFVFLQAAILVLLLYMVVRRLIATIPAPPRAVAQTTGLVDELTQTLNRRGIVSSLIEAMAQSQRYATPLSLASLDMDGVAALTERLGLEAKKVLLEAVSAILGEGIRLPDRLGRYQDHEFLVVLPQTHINQAVLVAERLRAAVAGKTVIVEGEEVAVTLSAGVAEFSPGQDLENFLANAHEALGCARQEGGNRVDIFTPQPAKTPP
ncbi:MAG TPA: GGDEF domain-containing protein [Acidiferrobacter sp.]|nr:GGDEF domain-containing protein [Acidiferrobacter sp.]